jgi:elongation factor Ts
MAITAKMVRDLRERTGAAMMDCKKALEASGGDLEAAIDNLRKSGLKSAEKRAGRSMAEGRIAAHLSADGKVGSMVALTSETDFVARTDDFGALLEKLAAHVAEHNPDTPESMLDSPLADSGRTVGEELKQLSGKLGENMQVGQIARMENADGRVGAYVHFDNKKGALISLTTSAPGQKAEALLKTLGMHITAVGPTALRREDVPAEELEREAAVYRESEEVLSKPADKQEMIVKGKLEKYLKGTVLLEQPWVQDDKLTVAKALEAALGKGARVEAFARFQVGG